MKRALRIGLPFAVLALAAAVAGYLRATRPVVAPSPPEARPWPVATVSVAYSDERPVLTAFGEVVAGREIDVRALVAGPVVEVGPGFVEGGVVEAGDLLVAVDPFDYRQAVAEAKARLDEARARVKELEAERRAEEAILEREREQAALAWRGVERRERLAGTAAGSEKALDDARLTLSQYEQKVLAREQSVERLMARADRQRAVVAQLQAALRRARRDLERTRLIAPFGGFLADIGAELGERVGAGERVARLIDAGRLEVRFHLSDLKFGRLLQAGGYQGRPVRVVWRVGAEVFAFDAEIARLGSEIDPASGGLELFASLRRAGPDLPLRPGAFVEIRVPEATYRGVVRLPETALFGGDTVYAVVDGALEARTVRFVGRLGADILVRGDLAGGEAVVTTRFPEIGPGVRVAVP